MKNDGRIVDVIIKDNIGEDLKTGLPIVRGFIVWADVGMKDVLKLIPGIYYVSDYGTCYYIDLDPRYDREFLRAEIEAQIKINGENNG